MEVKLPSALDKFRYTLPYASEAFGVYQPILGWKSQRAIDRFRAGLEAQEESLFKLIHQVLNPLYGTPVFAAQDFHTIQWILPAARVDYTQLPFSSEIASWVALVIHWEIQHYHPDPPGWTSSGDQWDTLLSWNNLTGIMNSDPFKQWLWAEYQQRLKELQGNLAASAAFVGDSERLLRSLIARESIVAGVLNQLSQKKVYTELKKLFSPPADPIDADTYLLLKQYADPLENFDPKTDLGKVGLSPVGLVHLFRQYFFEFDSFLGPPVQHVWLSPGGTVELIEISTRKTTIERTVEQAVETTLKSEKSTTDQDELSDAVKQENEDNSKFGATVSGTERFVFGEANETASVEFGNTQKQAREQTHKQMRQQTAKLSTEIKQSFKSTFRTVTETTDTSSKRYVLQNTTDKLVNYELRRKMRRVGVQVQDVGTQLCWQVYVDDPGADLGVAKLVHLAAPPDFSSMGPVNQIPLPEEYSEDLTGSFNLPGGEHTYTGWHQYLADIALRPKDGFECISVGRLQFTSGGSVDVDILKNRQVQNKLWQDKPLPPYTDEQKKSLVDQQINPPVYYLTFYLTGGHSERGGELMQFTIPAKYRPTKPLIDAINQKNADAQGAQTVEKNRASREAYITAARDRIKVASNVQPRPYNELREEERIVVYRKLLADLMDVGVTLNPSVLHKLSELLNAIFNIDEMLYFVAPEWWRPRHRRYGQSLAPELSPGSPVSPDTTFDVSNLDFKVRRRPEGLDDHVVGWGGADDSNRDNYYITEGSAPARLGSSLGWLLQLDGDNLRNAFLNAPWVKAVMPIRPGRELDALNWLTRTEIEEKEGLCDRYVASDAEEAGTILSYLRAYPWNPGDTDDVCSERQPLIARYSIIAPTDLTVMDALRYVAAKIKEKQVQGQEKITEILDSGVTLNYLPADRVYEYGFDPLADGFTAESIDPKTGKLKPYMVFDQWIEVLPTDQVVAVQVEYDPKTGQQT
jgi:hypothetical protein